MSAGWYVQKGEGVIGPIATELLSEGIRTGRVPLTSKVCAVGGSSWLPLANQTEFADAIRQVAPPPPLPLDSPPPLGSPPMPHRGFLPWELAAAGGATVLLVVIGGVVALMSGSPKSTAMVSSVERPPALGDGSPNPSSSGSTPSPSTSPSSVAGRARSSALNVCYKLQAAGVAYECVTKRDLVKSNGLADAAGFRFTSPVYGQVGTPGFVLQFRESGPYEKAMKDLNCRRGAPCVGSLEALLIVRTLYGGTPIPDTDWNQIQGVFNEIAAP